MNGGNETNRREGPFLDREKQGYLFFGILTTLVNYGLYLLFRESIGAAHVVLNTSLAWFGSVSFAYYTNRKWVFLSQRRHRKAIAAEFGGFLLSRMSTGLFDVGMMGLLSGILGFNDLVVKIITNLLVIVLNYIFSKWLVFGNPSNK